MIRIYTNKETGKQIAISDGHSSEDSAGEVTGPTGPAYTKTVEDYSPPGLRYVTGSGWAGGWGETGAASPMPLSLERLRGDKPRTGRCGAWLKLAILLGLILWALIQTFK